MWYRKSHIIFSIYHIFQHWIKKKNLTSHTDTKRIWIWVINIGWGMITVLLWKKSCIDLFTERLDIVLSDFCPDIGPWADIAVALLVFTYGQHWRYYFFFMNISVKLEKEWYQNTFGMKSWLFIEKLWIFRFVASVLASFAESLFQDF